MNGCYLLLVNLQKNMTIEVGKRGKIKFNAGYYVYVGSALRGIEQRVQRHLRTEKKRHWHIDYLLEHAQIRAVYYKEGTTKEECMIADVFQKKFDSVDGFGCSDCNCTSHLCYGTETEIIAVISSLDLKQYHYDIMKQ
jgi:Uri superfamily endonuclease